MKSRAFALAALFIVAGCGGGGGSTPAAPTQTTPNGTGQTVPMTFKILFPASATPSSTVRRPQYVSTGATQIEVIINSVNSNPPPTWVNPDVTTPLTGCTTTSGTQSCTVSVAAPIGNVAYTFKAQDSTPHDLAIGTLTIAIAQGQSATGTVTLQGVVSTVSVVGAGLTANTAISPTGETLTVTALDASNKQIVDGGTAANFNNPITLTDNDPTGQTKLALNGTACTNNPCTVTLNSPVQAGQVTLTYTGQAANGFTISASGTGITGGGTITTTVNDIVFSSGTTLDDTAHGGLAADLNYNAQTVFFFTNSGTNNISATESGFTNGTYSQKFDITLSGGCAGIATASPGLATTFTITAAGGVGICSGQLTEHGTGYPITQHPAATHGTATLDGTFYISVTSASFGVNSKLRHN